MQKTKDFIIKVAYTWYIEDWCYSRGITPDTFDPEVSCECYVCLGEFASNEFLDEEYMEDLFLNHGGFDFKAIMNELKETH